MQRFFFLSCSLKGSLRIWSVASSSNNGEAQRFSRANQTYLAVHPCMAVPDRKCTTSCVVLVKSRIIVTCVQAPP